MVLEANLPKGKINYCPVCGGSVSGDNPAINEKCPFDDCGAEYTIQVKKFPKSVE